MSFPNVSVWRGGAPGYAAGESFPGDIRAATQTEARNHLSTANAAVTPADFWDSLMGGNVGFFSAAAWTSGATGSALVVNSPWRNECRTGTTAGSTARSCVAGSSTAQGFMLRDAGAATEVARWSWETNFDLAFTAASVFSGGSTASIGRWTVGRDARLSLATSVASMSTLGAAERCVALEVRYNTIWLTSWNGTTHGQLNTTVTVVNSKPFHVRLRYVSGALSVSINGGAFSSTLATGLSGLGPLGATGFLVEARNETDTVNFESHIASDPILKVN